MSATLTPFGARPIGGLSGKGSYSGVRRKYKIASGYAANIFTGDFVKLVVGGTVEKDTGTNTLTPIGIAVGFEYTDPVTKQKLQTAHWPSGTVASDAVCFVVDDPDVLFLMQADGAIGQNYVGANAGVVQTAGSTANGQSKNALDQSTAADTGTLPLRIVEIVDGPDNEVGDAYTLVVCKFNAGHQLLTATGLALA